MFFFGNIGFLKNIFKSGAGLFVYGILSKFYLYVIGTSVIVVYFVFKGLSDAGAIAAFEKTFFYGLNTSKQVAQHCIPKISRGINEVVKCIANPPTYNPNADEKIKFIENNLERWVKDGGEKGTIYTQGVETHPYQVNPRNPYQSEGNDTSSTDSSSSWEDLGSQ